MGLFDQIVNRLTAGKEELAGAPKKLVAEALELFEEQKDGLQSVVDKLSASGLGEQVKTWVGTGANLPVTPDQIRQAFSPAELDRLALKTKLSVEEVVSHLAAALPQIVDKLTPDGRLSPESIRARVQKLFEKEEPPRTE